MPAGKGRVGTQLDVKDMGSLRMGSRVKIAFLREQDFRGRSVAVGVNRLRTNQNELRLLRDPRGRTQGGLQISPLHVRRLPCRPLGANRPMKGLDWRSRLASGVSLIRKLAISLALRYSRIRRHSANTGRTCLPSRAIQRRRLVRAWPRIRRS